jgi:predicted DCC family thiol-disulfide oxidoreductase YuxK
MAFLKQLKRARVKSEGACSRPLRDALYFWLARNRYALFGKRDVCMVPSAALRARPLDETRVK